MRKRFLVLLCTLLLLPACTSTSAPPAQPTPMEDPTNALTYCGIRMVVDGATVCPKNADGMPVELFLYHEAPYIPVQTAADALGFAAEWEADALHLTSGAERTAPIGKPPAAQYTAPGPADRAQLSVTLDGGGKTQLPSISREGTVYVPAESIAQYLNIPLRWDTESAALYFGEEITWAVSRKETVSDTGTAVIAYTYTDDGRLLTETGIQNGETLYTRTYRYNEAGLPVETCTNSRDSVLTDTYVYDESGRVLQSTAGYEGEIDQETVYTYDEQGNLRTTVFTGGGMVTTVEYIYDDAGHLLTQTTEGKFDGTVALQSRQEMTYDGYGNPVSVTASSTTYGSTTRQEQTLDDRGRVCYQKTISPDGTAQEETYTFNAFGNIVDVNGRTVYEYSYDDGGNLLSLQGNFETYQMNEHYKYDSYGNCVWVRTVRTVNGTFNTVTTTVEYIPIYH